MAESGAHLAGGGQPALSVASSHLAELLGAIDSVNNKAMFLIGLNVASNSLFVAVIASLSQLWWSAVGPIALALLAVGVGLGIIRQGAVPQFPSPGELLRLRGLGQDDDRTAWDAVAAINLASVAALTELRRTLKWAYLLGVLTAVQSICVAVIGAVLVL